jgi:uncharacterized protein YdaU (DUF1376 family)
MSFWNLEDGTSAADTGTEYEIPGGGNLEPIPADSNVLAIIDEAKWDEKDDAKYISLRWTVLAPDEYKNRKIFHKLWVLDDDPSAKDKEAAKKKRDKAKRMLGAIDANAGGNLAKAAQMPSDSALQQHLMNKPMIIKCMIWEMPDRENPGEKIKGNWIAAVAPASKGVDVKAAPPAKPKAAAQAGAQAGSFDMDDEIPF